MEIGERGSKFCTGTCNYVVIFPEGLKFLNMKLLIISLDSKVVLLKENITTFCCFRGWRLHYDLLACLCWASKVAKHCSVIEDCFIYKKTIKSVTNKVPEDGKASVTRIVKFLSLSPQQVFLFRILILSTCARDPK